MASLRFTFKKQPRPSGLASIGAADETTIKLGGKPCGSIVGPSWSSQDEFYRVRLMKIDESDKPCGWRWIMLKQKFLTEQEARIFITENSARIQLVGIRVDDDE